MDNDADDVPGIASLIKNRLLKKNDVKVMRMVQREVTKPWMIYPENANKANWDLFVTIILVFTCITTPARMAFVEKDSTGWVAVRWVIDIVFLLDIIIIFFSAYYDEDFRTIDDRKTIAKTYIWSWFFLDVFAIIPF